MRVIWLPTYCGNSTPYNAFWHDDVMIDTEFPDLTDCFRDTALTGCASACLLLLSPVYIYWLRERPKYRHQDGGTSCHLTAKLVLLCALTCLRLALFGMSMYYYLSGDSSYPPSAVGAHLLILITQVLTGMVSHMEYHRGIYSSYPLPATYLILLLTEGTTVWSYSYRTYMLPSLIPVWTLVCCVISFIMTLVVWVLLLMVDHTVIKHQIEADLPISEHTPLLKHHYNEHLKHGPTAIIRNGIQSPEETASATSRIFALWYERFVWTCMRRTVNINDIYGLLQRFRCVSLVHLFNRRWSSSGPKPTLHWVLVKCFWKGIAIHLAIRVLLYVSMFLQPVVLKALLDYMGSEDRRAWQGVMLAAGLMLCNMISGVTMGVSNLSLHYSGMSMRAVLTAAIFRKSLYLSNKCRSTMSVGEVVNCVSVDAQRIQDAVNYSQSVLTFPTMIIVITGVLWWEIGWSAIMILVVTLVVVPINGILVGKLIKDFQMKQLIEKDKRLKMLSEMLSGVKILKLYSWENGFLEKLTQLRNKELHHLTKSNVLYSFSAVLWSTFTQLVLVCVYIMYILTSTSSILTPVLAFVVSAYVQMLQFATSHVVNGISYMAQALASVRRINDFLLLEELPRNTLIDHTGTGSPDCAIQITNGAFSWETDEDNTLQNMDLDVKTGQLLAVVGHVGSGKTSLISAILGDMDKMSGTIQVKGSLACVPELPWIRNSSLRDNILMNRPYRPSLYNKVLDTCALLPDLDILVDGDRTEIGQKGINLSGGQKQRVSLARAVYLDRDIYLLDDPLSAVDSHVAKHLFDKVIGPRGALRNKTRILVTNNMTYLPQVDEIIMLEGGEIKERGSYDDLMTANGHLANFISGVNTDEQTGVMSDQDENTTANKKKRYNTSDPRQRSIASLWSRHSRATSLGSEIDAVVPYHALIGKEAVAEGIINLSSVTVMIKAIPWWLGTAALLFVLLFMTFLVLLNLQLAYWTTLSTVSSSVDTAMNETTRSEALNTAQVQRTQLTIYCSLFIAQSSVDTAMNETTRSEALNTAQVQRTQLTIYCSLFIAQFVSCVIASVFITYGFLTASRKLHSQLLSRIFHAPMSYFDTTPAGRILNRMSRDIDVLDFNIPVQLRTWILTAGPIVSCLISIMYINAWFLLVFVVLGVYLGVVFYGQLATSCQLRRLEAVQLSPLLVHFDDTLSGLSSIRAYQLEDWFIQAADHLIEKVIRPVYLTYISFRWCATRMYLTSSLIVFTVALVSVLTIDDSIQGDAGMSISVAMQAVTLVGSFVWSLSDLNSFLVSLERIKEYSNAPQEVSFHGKAESLSDSWPELGHVQYSRYTARYRPGLDLALNDLDLDVKPGNKVAVVGRTGAGKSSLSLALFRIFDGVSGRITIDGSDISHVKLHELRSRLTIIPQDPVVFSGTLRMNLDPYSKFSDSEIWTVLDKSHLSNFISGVTAGLEYECGDYGEALSLGQRQLLCLARALLRKSRVLVLDEATAAVDPQTDDMIQSTIRESFTQCTIITIAHRLTTILDYDKIAVLDGGQLLEYDSPNNLLNNQTTIFYSMAKAAGIINKDKIV